MHAAITEFILVIEPYTRDLRLVAVHKAAQKKLAILAGAELAQIHRGLLVVKLLGAADEAKRLHTVGAGDLNPHVPRGHGEQFAELLGEDFWKFFRVLDIIIIGVAGLGQPGHQILVVIITHADGRDGNPLFGQVAAEPAQFTRRAWSHVGKPVR